MRTLMAIALILTLSACNAFTDLEDEHGFELSEPTNNTQIDEPDVGQDTEQPPDGECREPQRLENFSVAEGTESCLTEVEDTYPDLVIRSDIDQDEPIFCVDDRGCYDPDCGEELADCLGVRLIDEDNTNNTSPPDLVSYLGCQNAIMLLEDAGFTPVEHYSGETPETLSDASFELCLDAATRVVENYDEAIADLATQEALEYACREGLFQCF